MRGKLSIIRFQFRAFSFWSGTTIGYKIVLFACVKQSQTTCDTEEKCCNNSSLCAAFSQCICVSSSNFLCAQAWRWGSAADGVGHGRPGGVRRHHQGLLPRRPGVRARILHHRQRLLWGGSLVEEKGTRKIKFYNSWFKLTLGELFNFHAYM